MNWLNNSYTRLGLVTLIFAALTVLVVRNVDVRNDAEIFLPTTNTANGRVVAEQMRKGPGASVFLIGLRGPASTASLARLSEVMAEGLRTDGRFAIVANGRFARDEATFGWMFKHRYLLDPAVRRSSFDPKALAAAGQRLKQELATSVGLIGPERLFADLTGRMSRILNNMMGDGGPVARSGVWFTRDGRTALLIANISAGGLELDAQAAAIASIRASFEAAKKRLRSEAGISATQLQLSGPGVFGVDARAKIKAEAVWLSSLASGYVLLLMILVLRSTRLIWAFSLTVGIGLIAGISVVYAVFGEVHGITITFGAMLIGLSVDYPLHVVMHRGRGEESYQAARRVWPTLRLSAASTVAAFIPLTFSSFPGLTQLGLVAVVGLVFAVLFSRYALPGLMGPGKSIGFPISLVPLRRISRPLTIAASLVIMAIVGAALYQVSTGSKLWEDNLASLNPVSRDQMALDRTLRAELTTVDPRYLILVNGASRQDVLQRAEDLAPRLARLVKGGLIKGWDTPTDYLPSLRTQRLRQARLPSEDALRTRLKAADLSSEFSADAFDDFVKAVAAAKAQTGLITPASISSTAFATRLNGLLFQRGGRWFGIVLLKGVIASDDVLHSAIGKVEPGVRLIDFRQEARRLMQSYRVETLGWLGIGGVLSLILLVIGLRRTRAVVDVVLPVLLAVATAAGVLMCLGIALSLFHILALMIVAGLGFDYAVFLQGREGGSESERNAFQSVTICAISTIGVYSILAFSTVPVLHGIGLTTAIGAAVTFVVTMVLAINRKVSHQP